MIDAQFLHDVAEFVNGRIAKVVLNGSYEITEFDVKQVDNSTVAMNYLIPASEISLLTLIELKDENDNLITSNNVNVPINADTLFLQTVEVKEVTS